MNYYVRLGSNGPYMAHFDWPTSVNHTVCYFGRFEGAISCGDYECAQNTAVEIFETKDGRAPDF
jgi:hypothetical protein